MMLDKVLQKMTEPYCIHAETIWQRLKLCGLKAYIHRNKPLLTAACKKRLEWAKSHADWMVEHWSAVIFSDKSKFNLIGSDGCDWCWRRPGEEFDAWFTKKKVKHGGGHIMVWGCITASGLGRLCRINGNMEAKLYCKILGDKFLGTSGTLTLRKKTYISNRTMTQSLPLTHTSGGATPSFQQMLHASLCSIPLSMDLQFVHWLGGT